ncbi:PAS domain S-box protein [Methanogenium marinum]|uniref:PAS domain S-box protein n=1 Tax=Methanogenium marinum TaxID=348610 RepID=A0A9Q4KTS1_9EURY|nr:PAS domain-containing protein [Methanogenium marinum]MDE4908584.1 PAS domain S-box protein [Methanogenium marinum]
MESYQDTLTNIREYLQEKHPQKISISAISRNLGIHRSTASKYLEILRLNGQVTMCCYGKSKLYTISDRIPTTSLFDCINEIIVIIDSNSRILMANKSFFSKFNIKNEREPIGKNIQETGLDIFSDIAIQKNIDRMVQGKTFLDDMLHLDDKTNRIYAIKFIPTVSHDGNQSIMISLNDITDQKQTEEALSISDEKLRTIFKRVPSGILFFNEEGNIINANAAALSLLGIEDYHELIGTNLFNLVCQKDKIKKGLMYGKAGGTEITCDFDLLKRDNIISSSRSGRGYFEAAFTHIASETGSQEFALLFMDVTTDRMAKIELKFNESRYRSFFNGTCTGVLIYQPADKGDDFIIKDVNNALEIILQVKKEELIGKKLFEEFPDLPINSVREALNRVDNTEIPEIVPPLQYIKNENSPWLTHFIFKLPTGEIASFMMDISKELSKEVTSQKVHVNCFT